MKASGKCPKCGSTDLIKNAKGIDPVGLHFVELGLATYENPDALFFKGKAKTRLTAYVCADCGLTEFYAENPRTLRPE